MATKRKTAKIAAGVEDVGGLAPKAQKSLATKLKKCKATYKIDEAVRKEGVTCPPQEMVLHLVRAKLLDPTLTGTLANYVAACDLDEVVGVAIAEALATRDEAGRELADRTSSLSWLEGWPDEIDALVYRAYAVAPAAFVERMRRFSQDTRRGLAFVQRRRGLAIAPKLAADILAELARGQATDYGISVNADCPFIDDDGNEVAHSVGDLDALRTLALRFGAAADWDRELAAATLENDWGLIENVASAIEQLPLAEITRLFATRTSMFGDASDADDHIAAIMDRRRDEPAELLAELAHVPDGEDDAERLREVFAAAAARKRKR